MGSLFTRSSGSGQLPPQIRADLAAQDVLFLQEGLKGSITNRNYRAPGQYTWLGKHAIRAALAITADRVVIALSAAYKELDVPRSGPWERVITANAERPDVVCISWQVGAFHRDQSGTKEVRLRIADARHIADILALR
jgi:hypothetical protein